MRDQLPRLAHEAQYTALVCDFEMARRKYAEAKAMCRSDCTPVERASLEAARVAIAMRSGEAAETALREGVRLAEELEPTHPLAALELLAELARWQPKKLMAQTADRLDRLDLSTGDSAKVALNLAIEPSLGSEMAKARGWWDTYALSRHQWRAAHAPPVNDDPYSAKPCDTSLSARKMGNIEALYDFVNSHMPALQACVRPGDNGLLPDNGLLAEAPLAGVARLRLWVDAKGNVTQLDAYGAFLRPSLLDCVGEALRSHPVAGVTKPGVDEIGLVFR